MRKFIRLRRRRLLAIEKIALIMDFIYYLTRETCFETKNADDSCNIGNIVTRNECGKEQTLAIYPRKGILVTVIEPFNFIFDFFRHFYLI